MNHSSIQYSQSINTQLVNQLVFFDEEKIFFLMQYLPDDLNEQKKVEQVLTAYTTSLEKIINDGNKESLNSIVLIGSQVTLRYEDDGYEEQFTIVFPQKADPSKNWISFLSPIGLQLLMTRVNESYKFVVPSGLLGVQIQEIKYMNYGHLDK
jgi:transcription elongation factor GreA